MNRPPPAAAKITTVILLMSGALLSCGRAEQKEPPKRNNDFAKLTANDLRPEIFFPSESGHNRWIRFVAEGKLKDALATAEMHYKIGKRDWKESLNPRDIVLDASMSDVENLENTDEIAVKFRLRNLPDGVDPNLGPFSYKFDYAKAVVAAYKKRALDKERWLEKKEGKWRFNFLDSIFPAVKEVRFGLSPESLNIVRFFPQHPSVFNLQESAEFSGHLQMAQVIPDALASTAALYVQLQFLDDTASDVRKFGSGEPDNGALPASRTPISSEVASQFGAGLQPQSPVTLDEAPTSPKPQVLENGMLSLLGLFTHRGQAASIRMGRSEEMRDRVLDVIGGNEQPNRIDPNYIRYVPHQNLRTLPVPLETGTIFIQEELKDGTRRPLIRVQVQNPGIPNERLEPVENPGRESAPELHAAFDAAERAVVFMPFSPNGTVTVQYALDAQKPAEPRWGGKVWGGYGFTIGRWDWAKTITMKFWLSDGTNRGPYRYSLDKARTLTP